MLSEANNAFACDLYRQLTSENSGNNLFFSPYSLFNALAMCAEGARGTTAEELGNVLRLPADLLRDEGDGEKTPWNLEPLRDGISELNSLMGCGGQEEAIPGQVKETRMKLWHLDKRAEEAELRVDPEEQREIAEETRREEARFKRIKARTDPSVIRVANSLWGERTCPFRNEYIQVIERHYQKGGISPVDFKGNAEGAGQLINDWVSRQTNGRITNIVSPSMLGELTRLILANAIYFKAGWVSPFIKAKTTPIDFTRSDGTNREVLTMIETHMDEASYAAFNGDGSLFPTPSQIPIISVVDPQIAITRNPVGGKEYPDENGFAMLDMPYKGRRISMVLIAPNRPDRLPAIERILSAKVLTGWIKQQRAREVRVLLPRFKFDTDYRMKGSLELLGLKSAFQYPLQDGGADFRGMTSSDEPDDQFFISEILHKAYVDVNEEGTEAAAATSIAECGSIMAPVQVPFTPVFKADRPFLCIIRERPTGTILFMGRVMDPR